MAVDPRRLRPGEFLRLINSTPVGEVMTERGLRRLRHSAGSRVGDDRTVDLVRVIAWQARRRRRRVAEVPALSAYEAHKERAAARARAMSLSARNITVPPVAKPRRRARCRLSFRAFAETYFRPLFALKWSADHLKVIGKIEQCVLSGGLFAMAMPRGSGKSTLCEVACVWAMLYGHRRYVVIIGSDGGHAQGMLDSIKMALETNDLLMEDFPEVCAPVRALERIYQRASGQLHNGLPTYMVWNNDLLVLPTIEGSAGGGSVVSVHGLTGQLRGMKHTRPDGTAVRPDLVLVDDPQTDESARSPSQCHERERVLAGAMIGMAGPNVRISGLMTLTVIREDDLADRILDPKRHPEWISERTRMVYSFPTDERLWSEYADLYRRGLEAGDGGVGATAFYRANRKAMDVGAVVAWPARKLPGELSALQHAMNLKIRDPVQFQAEYQNQPVGSEGPASEYLTADETARKLSGIKQGHVPDDATALTAFVDVQQNSLFWLVAAWLDDFTGYIVDYGTEPEQPDRYFNLQSMRRTLRGVHGAGRRLGVEALIEAGLGALAERVLGRLWRRESGGDARIDLCLVDANWGRSTDLVHNFCKRSPLASMLLPSHGIGITAARVPMSDHKPQRGDRVGLNWRIPNPRGSSKGRHVWWDTNWWKSFALSRLAVGLGDPGAVSLPGTDPERHRLLADHLTSELPVRTKGRGRELEEWRVRAPGIDNHWLDCYVGAAVAASVRGISLPGMMARPARKRVRLSDRQRERSMA